MTKPKARNYTQLDAFAMLFIRQRICFIFEAGDRRKFCVIDVPRQYENLRLSQE